MKAIMEFTLPEEQEEYELMNKAMEMSFLMHDIEQDIFRPHRKHGYAHSRLAELCHSDEVNEAIGILEEMYYLAKNGRGL
jgi:hypothetical protein